MGHFLCGVEGVKRFVNIRLHCNVSQPVKDQQNVDVATPWKILYGRSRLISPFLRAVESEIPSSDSDSWKFRLSDSNSDSGPTPTFSCISYLK